MDDSGIRSNLARLGELLACEVNVELLLIGGAAGVLTNELAAGRTTADCDVIRYEPAHAQHAVADAARQVAAERGLPDGWLNSQAMSLDILPDGWHGRKVRVGRFGGLSVSALSRRDLLATKFYAGHPRDVEDITAMAPTAEELDFVRTYLNMLRVPSRQANLDQVTRGLKLVDAFSGERDG